MSVARRLILMLVASIASLIFIGVFSVVSLHQSQARFDSVQTDILPSITAIYELRGDVYLNRLRTYKYLGAKDAAGRQAVFDQAKQADQEIFSRIAAYQHDYISDETDQKMLDTDKADYTTYTNQRDVFYSKIEAGAIPPSLTESPEGLALTATATRLMTDMAAHIQYNLKLGNETRAKNDASYATTLWTTVAIVAAMIVISGVIGIQIYRIITNGLGQLQRTLQGISESLDLTERAKVKGQDEIAVTARAFNALLTRVEDVLSGVRVAAAAVNVATAEIAQGNTDLSQRTEEQAASLQETASSMEQLSSAVRQNADNAKQASLLAISGSDVARRGGAEIDRVVETMNEIAHSSAKVSEIISVIESIAFQTNILALNAAVEAARAGEQGRGFAVVASEVRALAQRSATAAKEIKELITESVSRIDGGSKLVNDAGNTMREIVASATRTTDLMSEIASASEEQSTGIGQVDKAITQMDQVTQQNAALVEQAAAAAQAMAEQGQALIEAVAVFKVRETQARSSAGLARHAVAEPVIARRRTERKPGSPQAARASYTPSVKPVVAGMADDADWQTF